MYCVADIRKVPCHIKVSSYQERRPLTATDFNDLSSKVRNGKAPILSGADLVEWPGYHDANFLRLAPLVA
jgi:hypothetical protein